MISMRRTAASLTALIAATVVVMVVTSGRAQTATQTSPSPTGISKQTIVYFPGSDPIDPASFRTPQQLEQVLGAVTVYRWEDVIALDTASPVAALIFDSSSMQLINQGWVSDAYDRGVVIAAFNVSGPEIARSVGSVSVAANRFAAGPYHSDYFVMVCHLTVGENPQDVRKVENTRPGTAVPGITGWVSTGTSSSTDLLSDERAFSIFAQNLRRSIDQMAELRLATPQ